MIKEFRHFLLQTNALALAIGVIIGAASGKLVSAVVDDLIMPIIALALGGGDWRSAAIELGKKTGSDGKVTVNAITYGHFLGAAIDFVIIAFVVFMVTRALIKPAPDAPAA